MLPLKSPSLVPGLTGGLVTLVYVPLVELVTVPVTPPALTKACQVIGGLSEEAGGLTNCHVTKPWMVKLAPACHVEPAAGVARVIVLAPKMEHGLKQIRLNTKVEETARLESKVFLLGLSFRQSGGWSTLDRIPMYLDGTIVMASHRRSQSNSESRINS